MPVSRVARHGEPRRATVRAPGLAGEQDLVDGVDDAVRGGHVRCDDARAADEDLAERTRIASCWPFRVFTERRFVSLAAVSLFSATCSSSTERSFAWLRPSRASVASGTLAKAASVGAKTV